MGEVSKIVKNTWNIEPKHVKDFYESLVEGAKLSYKQNNIQIVLDKHINYMENNQEGDVTHDENLNSVNSLIVMKLVFLVSVQLIFLLNNSTSINTSYDVNSTPNDREYIGVLEQIINYLLRN
ncbi:unnamed protein product [Rhizophagus irregularis]|uniref:MATA-HMG n=1 Tax=Rhizophagus irregularis TaxID=588596 RepID=A0A2N1NP42_9GLOM|nr:hypothetical protein RhiirC2_773367 [Rhizophagus irregularis]CAB4379817.1 unnamed protein product [Rhizophagus irregularis]